MRALSRTEKVLVVVVAALGFALSLVLASGGIVRTFRNTSEAMAPGLRTGETLIVRTTRRIGAGDIVVFRYPKDPRTKFAKRAVAVSGDVVEIRNKELFVNGRPVNEAYVSHVDTMIYPKFDLLPEPHRSRDQFGPYRVPAGQIFVLGDNRDRSHDSRYWGSVPLHLVVGKVTGVFSWSGGLRKLK